MRKALQSSAAGKDGMPIEEWNYLDNFFKRYNKLLLDVNGIERERERLRHENGDLRSILKQYLDGISVNEDVINNHNPLLVVNHKTNIVTVSDDAQQASRPSPRRRPFHVPSPSPTGLIIHRPPPPTRVSPSSSRTRALSRPRINGLRPTLLSRGRTPCYRMRTTSCTAGGKAPPYEHVGRRGGREAEAAGRNATRHRKSSSIDSS